MSQLIKVAVVDCVVVVAVDIVVVVTVVVVAITIGPRNLTLN